MNIKILDSWLRDYLKTNATAQQIAEKLSLTSVGIERVEPHGSDFIYDIEVTTNRPDLASVIGLAREAGAVLPVAGIDATFQPLEITKPTLSKELSSKISLHDPHRLTHRICAVVMDVTIKPSPKEISERLETSDIRSLNNVIDVTNYVMRVIGHPTHVMDYDRIKGHKLTIRESRKGERIKTLDNKEYLLAGGDIVAEDESGEIVDLLGIMGLEASVMTDDTKRILFFVNTDNAYRVRKTSMSLGIRTEAAQLNEKGLDPELAMDALLYGIQLYEEIADGTVISEIIDIYPNKPKEKTIVVSQEKIQNLIGVPVTLEESQEILTNLGFQTRNTGSSVEVKVPSFRAEDISIPEDIVEEIARVYGYHNIPSVLPSLTGIIPLDPNTSIFALEKRVKQALKYWGFTEVYTYSMVSETMFDGEIKNAVTIANPLGEEFKYMRRSLVPSLLQVVEENKRSDTVKIFEIANVYHRREGNLPHEFQKLAGVVKGKNISFYEVKGIIEQLANDLGIHDLQFRPLDEGTGADIYLSPNIARHPDPSLDREGSRRSRLHRDSSSVNRQAQHDKLGVIDVLDTNLINFELNFSWLLSHASLKKVYTPLSKFPPLIEDISLLIDEDIPTADMINLIAKQSTLITDVSLFDRYQDSRAFHIIYQDSSKNLTSEDIPPIREKIIKAVKEKFNAKVKE